RRCGAVAGSAGGGGGGAGRRAGGRADAIVPSPADVARRALPQVIEAVLVPAAILMLVTTVATTTVAIGAALAWGIGALAWACVRRRRVGGITVLAGARLLGRPGGAGVARRTVPYFPRPLIAA